MGTSEMTNKRESSLVFFLRTEKNTSPRSTGTTSCRILLSWHHHGNPLHHLRHFPLNPARENPLGDQTPGTRAPGSLEYTECALAQRWGHPGDAAAAWLGQGVAAPSQAAKRLRTITSSFSDLFHLITSCDFLGTVHRKEQAAASGRHRSTEGSAPSSSVEGERRQQPTREPPAVERVPGAGSAAHSAATAHAQRLSFEQLPFIPFPLP